MDIEAVACVHNLQYRISTGSIHALPSPPPPFRASREYFTQTIYAAGARSHWSRAAVATANHDRFRGGTEYGKVRGLKRFGRLRREGGRLIIRHVSWHRSPVAADSARGRVQNTTTSCHKYYVCRTTLTLHCMRKQCKTLN